MKLSQIALDTKDMAMRTPGGVYRTKLPRGLLLALCYDQGDHGYRFRLTASRAQVPPSFHELQVLRHVFDIPAPAAWTASLQDPFHLQRIQWAAPPPADDHDV